MRGNATRYASLPRVMAKRSCRREGETPGSVNFDVLLNECTRAERNLLWWVECRR